MTTPAETVPTEAATAAKPQSAATHIEYCPDHVLVRDTAMQLRPTFTVGVLKVRPISKLVTMRLPSAQRARVFSDARNWIGYAEFKFEAGCCPVARHGARSSRRRANVRDR